MAFSCLDSILFLSNAVFVQIKLSIVRPVANDLQTIQYSKSKVRILSAMKNAFLSTLCIQISGSPNEPRKTFIWTLFKAGRKQVPSKYFYINIYTFFYVYLIDSVSSLPLRKILHMGEGFLSFEMIDSALCQSSLTISAK